MATEERTPPSNQTINGWLAGAVILMAVIGLPVMFCTGLTSGLTSGNHTTVVKEVRTSEGKTVEIDQNRKMTSGERMAAAQLGADAAYFDGDEIVTVTGGEAVVYEMKDGKHVRKEVVRPSLIRVLPKPADADQE